MKKVEKRKKRLFKKKIRNMIGGILLLCLIFNVIRVDAGENDSRVEKNRVEGIYAVGVVNGVERIFYLNMYTVNGITAYCIELGVDIYSDVYNSTSDFNVSGLNEDEIKYIQDISYFGYGYNEHKSMEYYMAAQELIWEFLGSIEIEWTNEMSFSGERINIDNYKNEIINLVNDLNREISLENYTDDMDVFIGDELVLRDDSNILKYYDVVSGEHCSIDVIDNNIYIKFDSDYVGADIIRLKRKEVYGYYSNLYYQDSSQKLVSNGNIDDVIDLRFNIKGKSLEIQLKDGIDIKKNGQFNYLGIAYELFSDDYKYYGRFECDKFGKIVIDNMPYGKYYIRGIGVNQAYYFKNIDNYFSFVDDSIIYLEVFPFVNEVEILKLYGDDDSVDGESNVVFEVYNKDGTLYTELITDEDGRINSVFPYGRYIVKQKTTSFGYDKVEDFEMNFAKRKNDKVSYTLIDKAIKSTLVINSKTIDGEMLMEDGLSYSILKDGNYIGVDDVNKFEVNDGILIFPVDLTYGDYVIEIFNDSINYKTKIERREFSINDTSEYTLRDGKLFIELDIIYDIKKGKINVNSLREEIVYEDNAYSYEYRANGNVNMDFVADEDIKVNGEVIYQKGEIIDNITTDEMGKYVIGDVYFGSYCLVNANFSKCFDVVSEDKTDVHMYNNLQKGNIRIHNMTNDFERIVGSMFELINEEGQVIYMGMSNEEGKVEIRDLAYGNYCVRERSVNDIYILNEENFCFSLDSDKWIELTILNERTGKSVIDLPNTFSDRKSIEKIVVLFLLFIIGGCIYKKYFKSS